MPFVARLPQYSFLDYFQTPLPRQSVETRYFRKTIHQRKTTSRRFRVAFAESGVRNVPTPTNSVVFRADRLIHRKYRQVRLSNPKQSFLCSENRNYLHAIAAKGAQKKTLEELIEEKSRVIEVNESNLTKLTLEKESMENTLNISQSEIVQLRASVEALKCQLEAVSAEKNRSIEHLDEELQAKEEMERELIALKQSSKQTLVGLERENHGLQQSLRVIEQQMTVDIQELTSERDILLAKTTELDEELRQTVLN